MTPAAVLSFDAWVRSRPEPVDAPALAPVLIPVGCDSCREQPREHQLFANLGRRGYRCARCWEREGRPTADWPQERRA